MITERQEKILSLLVEQYINGGEPVSSNCLKKECRLPVSPATIRNDLQQLEDKGYIAQPHASAGRVPTEKAYRHYVSGIFSQGEQAFPDFIFKEIDRAREHIEQELRLAQELMQSLQDMSVTLRYSRVEEHMMLEMVKIIGPSKTTYQKNVELINELLKRLEYF
ncbi:MAG: DeoR family transcriptional regulator [Candidatus Saccharimonadales bacterium]